MLIETPRRLRVHQLVHEVVDELERMQRMAFQMEAHASSTFATSLHTDFSALAAPIARSHRAIHALRGLLGDHAPTALENSYRICFGSLRAALDLWTKDLVVDQIRRAGTSLEHDYRQAARPGNVCIGPVGSSSMHGAVLVFGHELASHVKAQREASGGTLEAPPTTTEVEAAWQRMIAEMRVAELDGEALWHWARQELDAEYARLMPLPEARERFAGKPETSAGCSAARQPNTINEAILVVLRGEGEAGLQTWNDVLTRLQQTFGERWTDLDHVRKAGSTLVGQAYVRLRGAGRNGAQPVITREGLAHLERQLGC